MITAFRPKQAQALIVYPMLSLIGATLSKMASYQNFLEAWAPLCLINKFAAKSYIKTYLATLCLKHH